MQPNEADATKLKRYDMEKKIQPIQPENARDITED
jgi:hypothetical protein